MNAGRIRVAEIPRRRGSLSPTDRFGPKTAQRVRAFHKSFPEYRETPLVSLSSLARELGVSGFFVKDESRRFGLNAFKVLGGSYAVGRILAERLGEDLSRLPFPRLAGEEVRRRLGDLTFITATDGNHGRGVAWTANRLGQKCVVYLPRGSARERVDNIRALGADARVTDLNYDDTVRLAKEEALRTGGILVQDTSWEGYEEIPGLIMEGYTTMAAEAAEQLAGTKPTHLFLQAGVGAMAGALCGFFSCLYGEKDRPRIVVVEPEAANCLFRTARANDGRLHAVSGDMKTIMAGLCCGEPCSLGWEILRDHADFFVSMPDEIAAEGMRVLARPLPGDEPVVSGESGAAAAGLALCLLREPGARELRDRLGLDGSSRILCFSTEGDTDRENYRRIVQEGAYPLSGDPFR